MKTKKLIAMVAASLLLTACGASNQNNSESGKTQEVQENSTEASAPTLKCAKTDMAAKMLRLILDENAGIAEEKLKGKDFTEADFKDGVFSSDNLYEDSELYLHIVDKFWAVEKADGSVVGFFFKEGETYDKDANGNQDSKNEEIFIAYAFEFQGDNLVNVSEKYIPDEKTIIPFTKIKPELIWGVNINHYDFGKIRCAVETDGDVDVIYFAYNGEKFVISEP